MIDPGHLARYRSLVDDWGAFLEALARPLPVCVWTNTLRTTAAALEERLASRWPDDPAVVGSVSWCPGAIRVEGTGGEVWRPGRSFEFLSGLCHVQEEASLIPTALLEPQPGERVLDLCAAPGGKTARMAVAMENRGTLVANDVGFQRIRSLRGNLDRLGIVNTSSTIYDGANFPPDSGLFDRVLADVPCGCEGTSRKNPEVLERSGVETLARRARVQKAILRKAVRLARPGGRIVYSTCTYAPEENEAVVDAILREEDAGALRVLPARIPGLTSKPGLTEWLGRGYSENLEGCLRIWPHHNDTGGFFVAVLEKAEFPAGNEARRT